ncbi:uncharacterized protein HKW66_Vig0025290 [Vigna angularis]|uniref:SHSP domain-containing protein n=2 Tax=Phaseolus angularis TaxID=3914 RepID=A0A8T0L6B6_PHAAN|nr:uncharacterized protein LOC108345927 [Vigna angularis]KAG2407707.1 uncharacterized protein HKW66_Vig0025290 [Vigna angularis]
MARARGDRMVGGRTSAGTPVLQQIVPNSGWTQDSAGHYLLVDLPEFRKEEVKLQVDSYGRIVVKGERQINAWKHDHFRLTFPAPLDSDMDRIAGKFDGGVLYVTIPKQVTQHSKVGELGKVGNGKLERAEENGSHRHGNGEDDRAKENDSHRRGNEVTRTEKNDSQEHGNDKVERTEENDSRASEHDKDTEQEVKRNENERIKEFPEQVIRKWEEESMLRGAVDVLRENKGIVVTAVVAFSLGFLVYRKFNSSVS